MKAKTKNRVMGSVFLNLQIRGPIDRWEALNRRHAAERGQIEWKELALDEVTALLDDLGFEVREVK